MNIKITAKCIYMYLSVCLMQILAEEYFYNLKKIKQLMIYNFNKLLCLNIIKTKSKKVKILAGENKKVKNFSFLEKWNLLL